MGMFTELNIACDLAPVSDVVTTLDRMCSGAFMTFKPAFKHPFFETLEWREMLRSDSVYFPGRADSKVFVVRIPGLDPHYSLNVRCNLKNYDEEIEMFLDWLGPYILTEGFIGYYRYEEDEAPTLLYANGGKVEYQRVVKTKVKSA